MNDIAVSFTEALQKRSYDLRLIPVKPSTDWKELVLGKGVDGLAFLLDVPEPAHEVVRSRKLPSVVLGDRFEDVPNVMPDDGSGGFLATRHLLGLGHKKIVYYVADTIRPHLSVSQRQEGYERAMRDAGLADLITVWHMSTNEAIARLLDEDPPTAMIGYCHVEALQVTHAAWAHGLSIPTDLSLIAFNDMAITENMTPPLSVVGFDTRGMGETGAEILVNQIESPSDRPHGDVLVSERLIVRGTTAPPSGKR